MADNSSLDLVARDPNQNAVLMLTFIPVHHGFGRFAGEMRAFSEEHGHFAVEVIAGVETEDDDFEKKLTDGTLLVVDSSGQQIGREIHGYEIVKAVGGRYEIHSGTVDGEIDVFAVSDPIELAVAGLLLGACALRTLANHHLIKEMAQIYREQGRAPRLRMKSGLKSALTCDIQWEISD